ncbi:MAG TPA: hypothetical protein HPQ04_13105, partial [Rhodospirillaceae bacterium]|nr:hypothetical protein [Rhodospirillaceae bacterium]
AATTTFTVGAARSVVNGNGGGNTLADFAAWLHAQQIGAMAGPNQLTLKIGDGANGTLAVNNAGGVLGDDVTLSGAMASDLGFSGANATAAHNTAANGLGSYRVFATVPNTSAFQSLKVGDSFTVSGAANDANNGSFYVAGKDLTGASLTISRVNLSAPASLTATTNDTNALISSGAFSYGNSGAYSTGALTFTNTNNVDTIVATTANSLQTIPVGGFITVANATNAANNGTYVVTANTGTQITLSAITQTSLTAEAANAAATINNGTPTTFTPGTLAFFAGGSTIQAGNTGTLAGLKIGQTVNVSGTASNNGSLVVTNTFPSSVTSEVETPTLTAAADGQAVISGAGSTFGATGTLVNTGNLTFTNPNTITATTGGSLANLTNGSRITITNAANPLNDGTFVVIANSGTSVQLALPTQMVVNGGTALSPADPVTFAASAATPSMTGSSADLGSLKAGDVIAVSGTASNNANFVVSGTPSAKLSSEAGTAGVIFTSGATVVNTLADTTTVNAANGVIFTAATSLGAFVAGQSVTLTNAVQATNNAAQTVTKIFNDVVAAEGPLAAGSITLTRNNSATALSTSGTFTFAAGPAPTLTAGTAADVASVAVGDIITVGGSGPSNNLKKSFVVTANAGGVLSLSPAGQAMRVADLKVPLAPPNTAVQVAKNISVSTSTYYQGNSTVQTQQVDTNRSMTFGVTAMDPAFEKAIRAMQMIAQGTLGTAGGLDLNRGRLTTATQLMFSAATQAAAPSSTELSGNILSLQNILAVQQKDLGDIGTQQTTYLDFVQGMHDQLIGVDQQSTIENLLNQQQALQASYQSMASVRQLSLLTYLK